MQDYAKQLLSAINQCDADDPESVNHLRDLVCWISDDEVLKQDKMIAQLLYIASQKMRVFGYNMLNGYSEDPNEALATLDDVSNQAIKNLYRSRVNEKNTLDKSQMEVVDLFQSLSPRRLLVSAPTSYGKTFLMREIVFLNKDRYNKLWATMESRGISTYQLCEKCGIDSKTVRRLWVNENIETKTLDKLCVALSCRLENIAEFVPDGKENNE